MSKSLVIPQAGEEANEKSNLLSLREKGQMNRYANFTLKHADVADIYFIANNFSNARPNEF